MSVLPTIRLHLSFSFVFFVLLLSACRKEKGCTDPEARNYEESAELEDGSCNYALKVRFRHEVNGKELEFNDRDYVSAEGDTFRITRLRYLVSELILHRSGASDVRFDAHHLVRIAPNNSLTYVNGPDNPSFTWAPSGEVPKGTYEGISLNFGLDDGDNRSGAYGDLNQANWGWPEMLGGGYHFLQFEGTYDSAGTAEPVFNMHMGRARDTSGSNTSYLNNHFHLEWDKNFTVDGSDQTLTFSMDLGKWFAPPPPSMEPGNGKLWDLEKRPKAVMPDYASQRVLNANGRDALNFVP